MDLIVVNPCAGNGISLKYLEKVVEIYRSFNREYLIIYPPSREATVTLTRYYANLSFIDNIVSVGGDGTLNSVLNGMINSKKGLIIVPAGTGNDFYRTILDFPKDFLCDVGMVNNEYFLCTLSIGIDALIANYANKLKEKGVKGNVYVRGIGHFVSKYESFPLVLKSDEYSTKRNITMLSFCNAKYYGKGIKISPNTSLQDGKFDAYLIKSMPNYKLPILVMKLLVGLHETDRNVIHFETSNAHVEFMEKQFYSFDGEVREAKEIIVSNKPAKVLIKKDFQDEIKKLTKIKK